MIVVVTCSTPKQAMAADSAGIAQAAGTSKSAGMTEISGPSGTARAEIGW